MSDRDGDAGATGAVPRDAAGAMPGVPEAVVEGAARCLLACRGPWGPLVVPLAYWYDGEALWALAAADAPEVAALERDGGCAVGVRGRQGAALARGDARVLSLRDPAGLVLRVPALVGALAGLALRAPSALLGTAREAVLRPDRPGPQNLAVLRVRLVEVEAAPGGAPPPGIAPALPPAIPAALRRALAGARRVVVARQAAGAGEADSGPVELVPGWLDQRYALVRAAGGRPLPAGEPVAVAVDVEPGPGDTPGLVLYGRTRAGGVLDARRATFWLDHGVESVELPPARSELTLPD